MDKDIWQIFFPKQVLWKSTTLEHHPVWTTEEKKSHLIQKVTQSTLPFTKTHYSFHTSQQIDCTLCSAALRPQQEVKQQCIQV